MPILLVFVLFPSHSSCVRLLFVSTSGFFFLFRACSFSLFGSVGALADALAASACPPLFVHFTKKAKNTNNTCTTVCFAVRKCKMSVCLSLAHVGSLFFDPLRTHRGCPISIARPSRLSIAFRVSAWSLSAFGCLVCSSVCLDSFFYSFFLFSLYHLLLRTHSFLFQPFQFTSVSLLSGFLFLSFFGVGQFFQSNQKGFYLLCVAVFVVVGVSVVGQRRSCCLPPRLSD